MKRRKDGLVCSSVVVGHKDGKPIRKSFYGHTKKEVQAKKEAYLRENVVQPDIRLSDWVEAVKSTYRVNVHDAYIKSDNVHYNRLVKDLGQYPVRDITQLQLQKSVNQMSGMSSSSITKYVNTIKKVFRRARQNRIIMFDPAQWLEKPRGTTGTHRALSKEEIDLILNHYSEHYAGIWCLLMLLTGMRRGEMFALDWKNVNLESRFLTVCQTGVILHNQVIVEDRAKSLAGIRTIPLPDLLVDALKPGRQSGRVCVSAKGKPLSEEAFKRGLEGFLQVLSKAAGKPISFRTHDLRHTYATMLYENKVPLKEAQYYLGHSDVTLTLGLYTHLTSHAERASAEIIHRMYR